MKRISQVSLWTFGVFAGLSVFAEAALAQSWTRLSPAGTPPPFRCFGATTVADPATNRLMLFGGNSCSGFLWNDVWVLTNANGTGGTPQWTNLVAHGAGGSPSARANHTAAYDPATNRMIVYSGCQGGCLPTATDVWVLANANGLGGAPNWTRLFPSGPTPGGRNNHKAVYDSANNRMIVFGGQDGGGSTSSIYLETWVLSNANGLGGTPNWTLLSPSGGPPPAEYVSSATYDAANNRMIVFGGVTRPGATENAVWVLSNANGLGGTPVWTNTVANGAAGSPSARAGSQTAYVPSTNRMLAFDGGGVLDTWMLSNANGLGGASTWTQMFPAGGPPPGTSHLNTSVYDVAAGRMTVMVNGAGGAAPNEMWVLSDVGGTPPAPTLTGITVNPASATIDVGATQQFTATANYSDGSSQTVTSGGAGLTATAATTFGGTGNQYGTAITVAGGKVYWGMRSEAANDAFYGSHNAALTAVNFSQALGGLSSEVTGVSVLGGSLFAAGSSRPPALTVDHVGGWENKPVAFRLPASGGSRDWLVQMAAQGYNDRVFSYSGTEWSADVEPTADGSAVYVAGGGENWGVTGHYAFWLSRVSAGGTQQWNVQFGQPGVFTAPFGVAVIGNDVFAAGTAGDIAIIRKYHDTGGSASLVFGSSYGPGVLEDVTALDGFLYAVGRVGNDIRILKVDAGTGAQVWSNTLNPTAGADVLRGVVAHAGRVFAVGSAGSDAVVVEIDPATGGTSAPLVWGAGAFNRLAVDAATGRLYAIGTTAGSGQDVVIAAFDTGGDGVAWDSSNDDVAPIDPAGLASGASAGSTTITATWHGFSDIASLTVASANEAPVADAGPDQTVEATSPGGAAVTLDGSASSDPDGDALSFNWSGPFGAASGVGVTVALPLGLHTITLAVSDSQAGDSDQVQVLVVDTTAPALVLPADTTVEATSAAGATLHYSASAFDAVDPAPALFCTPASGSTFALGATAVHCTATDASGNGSTGSFTVTVADTTAPVLTVPDPITIFAAYPDETAVDYVATAVDSVDPAPSLLCSPFPGATFGLGTTTVFCSAADAAGNGSTASFTVTVIDSGAPLLNLPADITASASSSAGAVVIYAVSATDGFDADVAVSCIPASGTTFALGTTLVECSGQDDSGNGASGAFSVTVVDDGAPALTVAADITVNATSPAGAVVTFTASASDTVDPGTTVNCTPPSGSTFAVGTTIVTCSATDASGNSTTASFAINVLGSSEQLDNALAQLDGYNLPEGTETSLGTKLQNAEDSLAAGDTKTACNQVKAFINEVKAQSGKALTKEQADALLATARQIQAAMGC